MIPDKTKERRSGPDILIKTIKALGVFCWSLLILSMLLVDKAKPRIETFFDRILDVQLEKNWDQELLQANFYVVLAIFGLSMAGLLFNKMRARRKRDRYNHSLVFMAILSIFAIIFSEVVR